MLKFLQFSFKAFKTFLHHYVFLKIVLEVIVRNAFIILSSMEIKYGQNLGTIFGGLSAFYRIFRAKIKVFRNIVVELLEIFQIAS